MLRLEIPLQPKPPELIDPHYMNRHALTGEAPSLPAIMLGHLANRELFSQPVPTTDLLTCSRPRYVNLPLEIEEEDDRSAVTYILPDGLEQFREAIGLIAAHEHGAYPEAVYSRIRIDPRQSVVDAGTTSFEGQQFHRDRSEPRQWEHIYVVTDKRPTEFYPFDEPTPAISIYPPELPRENIVTADPYQIAHFNSTAFHRKPAFDEPVIRTFLHVWYTHDLTAASA